MQAIILILKVQKNPYDRKLYAALAVGVLNGDNAGEFIANKVRLPASSFRFREPAQRRTPRPRPSSQSHKRVRKCQPMS